MSHLLQILDVLVTSNSLFSISTVQSFEVVLQFVYLITIVIVLLSVTMSLLINIAYKLVQLLYYPLLHTTPAESEILFDITVVGTILFLNQVRRCTVEGRTGLLPAETRIALFFRHPETLSSHMVKNIFTRLALLVFLLYHASLLLYCLYILCVRQIFIYCLRLLAFLDLIARLGLSR